MTCDEAGQPKPLNFKLEASEDEPVVNVALVINGWGEDGASLMMNGKKVEQGKDFRIGHRRGFDTSDLIVWIKIESTKPVEILLQP